MFDERIALGLPSLAGYSLTGALTKARDLGFQSVMALPDGPRAEHSLGAFPTLGFYNRTGEQQREMVAALAPFRHIAIHQAWDDQWAKWIDCAACVGADVVTIHSGLPREGQRSSEFIEERVAHLRRIGDYAGENGVRIGIENEGGTCEDYLGLVAAVAHPAVGATLDLGHCAYFQRVLSLTDFGERAVALNETIRTVVRALGRSLFSLHAHDVRQSDWRDHRCAGSGVIDYPGLFEDLRRIDYTGLFEIELEEPDKETAAVKTGTLLTTLCRTLPARQRNADSTGLHPAGAGGASERS